MTTNSTPAVLVLNAGSSSVKFALFRSDATTLIANGQIENIGRQARLIYEKSKTSIAVKNHQEALAAILDVITKRTGYQIEAVGHRVVHGADKFLGSSIITPDTIRALEEIAFLAPQHMPHHISAIRACQQHLPNTPQVACFDTTFHQTQSASYTIPAVPATFQKFKRYGFHGLSYTHIINRLSATLPYLPAKILAAHMGNGVSLCAIVDGKSHATTMGFSTLDGVVMGSRSGSLDPGLLLHLLSYEKVPLEQLRHDLYNNSGLLGLSQGKSSDMRTLLESDEPSAKLAIEAFVTSVIKNAGSMIALMGGMDAIVFTGGIGENSPTIREQIIERLSFFDLQIDSSKNQKNQEGLISLSQHSCAAFIVKADEENVIAQATKKLTTPKL